MSDGTAGAARYTGARINRVEDARLLTGQGTFVDDVALPGMLHACFVRSPFPRAAIRGIDTTNARAVPGVRSVFTADDLNPGVHEQWHTSIGPTSPETPRPPLAEGEVRFVGDPVALVIADSRYVAEDAAELVEVDYEPLPAVVDYATAAEHRRARAPSSRLERHRRARRASPSRRWPRRSRRRRTSWARRSASRPAPRCPWRARGLVVDCSPATGEHHDPCGDPIASRGAPLLRPPARVARAPDPGRDARHRRRVRAEGARAARRDVHHARRPPGRASA